MQNERAFVDFDDLPTAEMPAATMRAYGHQAIGSTRWTRDLRPPRVIDRFDLSDGVPEHVDPEVASATAEISDGVPAVLAHDADTEPMHRSGGVIR